MTFRKTASLNILSHSISRSRLFCFLKKIYQLNPDLAYG